MDTEVVGDDILLNGNGAPMESDELVWSDEEMDNDEPMEEVVNEPTRYKAANELEAMMTGHVKVISVLGPYEFYVLSKEMDKKFKELELQLDYFCTKDPRSKCLDDDLKVDRYVVVFSNYFKRWCRAQVVTIHASKSYDLGKDLFCDKIPNEFVSVRLIDYKFNENEIPIKHVRFVDSHFDFDVWPVTTIKCALAGFKTDPRKTFEATDLMNKLVLNKHVWFCFQTIIRDTTYIAITYSLRGVSVEHLGLRESLITSGFGSIDPRTDLRRVNFKFGKVYREQPIPKVNEVFTGVVSHAESPDRFFINRASDKDTIYDQQKAINDFFGIPKNAQEFKLFHFIKGMACIARFPEDDSLYRAIIDGVDDLQKKCLVRYVDYGNISEVPFSDIYMLPDQFLQNPKMCLECKLAGIEPTQNKWSVNFIRRFRQLLGDSPTSTDFQHLAVSVQYRDRRSHDSKIPVTLRRWEPGNPDINVADELIKEKMAKPSDSTSTGRAIAEIMRENVSSVTIIRDICERHEKAQSSLRERLIPIVVTNAAGPEEIWVRIELPAMKQIYTKFFQELQKKMQEAMAVKQEKLELQRGHLCAIRVPASDGTFFVRGKILEKIDEEKIEGNDVYKIRAIDNGTIYKVAKPKIFELPTMFVAHDPYAVKCSLFGIKSSQGDDWTVTSMNKVVEFMQDSRWNGSLFLLVKEKILGNNPDTVVKCNIIGEEHKVNLFGTESVYHSLCDMMTDEYGVALPLDKSLDYVTDKDILNDKSPVHSTEVSHRGVPDVELNQDSLYSRIMQATTNSEEVCYYPPSTFPASKTFEAQVTNVDEKFEIAFRLTENGTTLAAINRDISNQLVNGGLTPFNAPHSKGRACTARFSADKSWNRAKFLGFCHGNIVEVYFVDYGNKDKLFLENLSQKVFAPNTPELAIKAKFYGAKPFSNKIIDFLYREMYDLLVDKVCIFTWENHPNLPMKVAVVEKSSGIDIKKTLINKDLLTETLEIQEFPATIIKILAIVSESWFSKSLFDDPGIDLNCYIPVCCSAKLAQNMIFLQIRQIDNATDEQNEYINQATERFLRMLELLQPFSLKQREVGMSIKVGDPCLALYSDKRYYRALAVDVKEDFNSEVTVFFVDYGNIAVVDSFSVRELPSNYVLFPPPVQGAPVLLQNIKPKSGIWTPELEQKVGLYLEKYSQVNLDSKELLIAKMGRVTMEVGDMRHLPKTIRAAELFVASCDNPLIPVRRAFESLVASGDLEFIDVRQPI